MGSGKTTFGRKLAAKLKVEFVDIDDVVISKHQVKSIKELIEVKGMDFFRQAESDALRSLTNAEAVISTGGGTPCYFDNLGLMKGRGVVVFLQLEEGAIFSRLKTTNLDERPLLKGLDDEGLKAFIHDKLEERMPFYNRADMTFNPMKQKIEELITQLQSN